MTELTAAAILFATLLAAGLLTVVLVGGWTLATVGFGKLLGDALGSMAEAHYAQVRADHARWAAAGATIGWTRGDGLTLRGTVGGHPAELSRSGPHDRPTTVLEVHCPAPTLRLRRGTVLRLVSRDARTGDRHFDEQIDTEATPESLPWLTASFRQQVLDRTWRLSTGSRGLRLQWPGPVPLDDLPSLLAEAEEAVAGLPMGHLNARRTQLVTDPTEPARLRSQVVTHLHEAGAPVPAVLLEDAAPTVRLAAARALDASEVLLALVRDDTLPWQLRLGAAASLAERGSPEATPALRVLLASDERRLWFRGVKLAQEHVIDGAVDALASLHERGLLTQPHERSQRLARGVTVALRHQGRPEAEPLLLALLGDPRGAVSRYAAEALTDCGTVAAVPRLQARMDRVGHLSIERATIAQAIRRIQGRAAGEAGSLAIADTTATGAVSVASPAHPHRARHGAAET